MVEQAIPSTIIGNRLLYKKNIYKRAKGVRCEERKVVASKSIVYAWGSCDSTRHPLYNTTL